VISPANDLGAVARYVEQALEPGAQRPTFSSVHGADSTVVRAADLTLDKFIDAETLEAAKTLPRKRARTDLSLTRETAPGLRAPGSFPKRGKRRARAADSRDGEGDRPPAQQVEARGANGVASRTTS
jgi:hypothetical protein